VSTLKEINANKIREVILNNEVDLSALPHKTQLWLEEHQINSKSIFRFKHRRYADGYYFIVGTTMEPYDLFFHPISLRLDQLFYVNPTMMFITLNPSASVKITEVHTLDYFLTNIFKEN
jgi:hypothetical protein